jgi:hypothetical protein
MPTLNKAPAEVAELVNDLMERYHGPLHQHGVTVDLMMAFVRKDDNGDAAPEACAVKQHGYRVAACIRINSYKLRVQGHGDAEITLDGDRWDEWSDDEKEAILDHELEHLDLKFDPDGLLLRDDLDRPRLKLRTHDHQFGWFDSIARRHGPASLEVQQARKFFDEHFRQKWLPFMDVATPALAGTGT